MSCFSLVKAILRGLGHYRLWAATGPVDPPGRGSGRDRCRSGNAALVARPFTWRVYGWQRAGPNSRSIWLSSTTWTFGSRASMKSLTGSRAVRIPVHDGPGHQAQAYGQEVRGRSTLALVGLGVISLKERCSRPPKRPKLRLDAQSERQARARSSADRASASGAEGREFESRRARHPPRIPRV
jgi:hypothetical protein